MIITKEMLVVGECTKKEEEHILSNILIEENTTVATDGHILAVSKPKVSIDSNNFPLIFNNMTDRKQPTFLNFQEIKKIQTLLPKKSDIPILDTVLISGLDENEAEFLIPDWDNPVKIKSKQDRGKFVAYKKIIENVKNNNHISTVKLGIPYLEKIVNMAKKIKSNSIYFDIYKYQDQDLNDKKIETGLSFKIEGENTIITGILMPMEIY